MNNDTETLIKLLKAVIALFRKRGFVGDAKGDRWITTSNGKRVELDEAGNVKKGLGGGHEGENIKEAAKSMSATASKTPAATAKSKAAALSPESKAAAASAVSSIAEAATAKSRAERSPYGENVRAAFNAKYPDSKTPEAKEAARLFKRKEGIFVGGETAENEMKNISRSHAQSKVDLEKNSKAKK